jgi:anti-sigma factor RsiW
VPVPSNRHASDETLEQNSMGRLSGSKLDEFEEHLLTCAPCQDRLASTDACIGNIRSAAAELARQSAANRWFHKLFDLPGAAWAFGLAAVGLAIAGRHAAAGRGAPNNSRISGPENGRGACRKTFDLDARSDGFTTAVALQAGDRGRERPSGFPNLCGLGR